MVAAWHTGMGVDAVPELPFELGVSGEDRCVVAQGLAQENLQGTGGIPRIDLGIAAWDATCSRTRLVSRARAPSRAQAKDEACDQGKSNGNEGRRAHLPVPPGALHSGLLYRPCNQNSLNLGNRNHS